MKGKTILLVEDNAQVMHNNATMLRMCGAKTLCAPDLAGARAHIAVAVPDAAVIDIMLPDGTGLDLLRELRTSAGHGVPVLLLTAKGDSEDIVTGLRLGADDYLAKPYDLNVLQARIEAMLRRSSHLPQALRCGPLTLRVASNTVRCSGRDLHITQKEFALLLLLAQNPKQTLKTAYLYEKVWGKALGAAESSTALRIQISNLKKKLAAATDDILIESSRGEGYRLTVL